jgi:hypothetical protein
MTLYHFTDGGGTSLRDSIGKEGLKANCSEEGFLLQRGKKVVWFTTEADPVWWWVDGETSKFRATVEIPSTDKRLVRYDEWMKKNFAPKVIKAAHADPDLPPGVNWKSWYMYFGDVPPSKIRAVEYADPKRREEKRTRTRETSSANRSHSIH